ncbi:hypothetical protein VTJ49DRAFT_7560 [Mycothermus thermophilus]|uniref:J domain-containing protein n=1 Tax=Humicola insolens TaxID=85995 RepID=A0ABR3VGH0_HUMIN
MPLRYNPTGAARSAAQLTARAAPWSDRRFFHPSPPMRRLDTHTSGGSNHYETLNVQPDASPAEIKKSFYLLSKRHHPDVNPSDPHAPARFMRISEAYATLSHAEKRALYDRDVMSRYFSRRGGHHTTTGPPGASYHSTGPAGGRPASGLSRRRGTYQGPPPSFYRSGGWGAHAAKRRAAHEESTGTGAGYGTHAPHNNNPSSSNADGPPPPPPPPGGGFNAPGGMGGGGWGTGGMGPGQDPFHDREVPHFDREAHERAQRRSDSRRAHRMAQQRGVNIDTYDSPTNLSFFGVAGILTFIVFTTFWLADRAPPSQRARRGAPGGNGSPPRTSTSGANGQNGRAKET